MALVISSSRQASRCMLGALLLSLLKQSTSTRHSFITKDDRRTLIGPVGVPFGFAAAGKYELKVFDFEISGKGKAEVSDEVIDSVTAGFYLRRYHNEASFQQDLNRLQTNHSACAFDYFLDNDINDPFGADEFDEVGEASDAEHGILLAMKPRSKKWKPAEPSVQYTFRPDEAGLYFLFFQICAKDPEALSSLQSSFELDFHFRNIDASGQPSYLTAGELHLPFLFFFFSMSYLICVVAWSSNILNISSGGPGIFNKSPSNSGRPIVYPIHKLMGALLCFKFLSVLFESIRYHAIRITGHSEFWSVLYYATSFIRGIFLFTVILLIGTGWSFVKPFLSGKEKQVIFVILILQVINNIVLLILNHETAGERAFDRWNAVLHLVDIVCCCSVLLPIVWQVTALEKSLPRQQDEEGGDLGLDEYDVPEGSDEDREKEQILSKLKLFRSFYLLVIFYIYATRILVYLFATMLDYRYLWLRYFAIELITLTFYVLVGFMFRPMAENPYLSVKQEENSQQPKIIALTSRKEFYK